MGMIEEIRAQYEKLAAQNKMEAEDMIKDRLNCNFWHLSLKVRYFVFCLIFMKYKMIIIILKHQNFILK